MPCRASSAVRGHAPNRRSRDWAGVGETPPSGRALIVPVLISGVLTNSTFRVGLPVFEPGTSASRTEPWAISSVLVRRRTLENVLVNSDIFDPSADRSRPRNTAVLQRSAPFPRQCALRRKILLTQIGCSAFTALITSLALSIRWKIVDNPEGRRAPYASVRDSCMRPERHIGGRVWSGDGPQLNEGVTPSLNGCGFPPTPERPSRLRCFERLVLARK